MLPPPPAEDVVAAPPDDDDAVDCDDIAMFCDACMAPPCCWLLWC